jgi:DNA-3-methyladenine glycosylase
MGSNELSFLNGPAEQVAPLLLGCELVRQLHGQELRARIVEVEAYDQTDQASHTFRGQTKRNQAMFGPSGHLYVYFTYGMHYCCNVVTGHAGYGSGVLIRAVQPLQGETLMSQNRHGLAGKLLTNGPGKLCQALQIDLRLGGHDLAQKPLQLIKRPAAQPQDVVQTTRIGIKKNVAARHRFYLRDNAYVSQKATPEITIS